MSEHELVIETRDLTKRYGEHILAVDGLALRVRRGEVYGFLGPNGAGKTTTLRMLLGLVRPTRGTAVVLGSEPGSPGGLARIGAMIEAAALYPFLSARDNLRVLAHHAGVPEERIAPALEEVGLGPRAGDRFGTYSQGMKQRLGVAAALIKDPDLLILDEPTNDLDIPTLEVLEDGLAEFEGGLVLVTHDRFMLDRLATAILALDGEGGAETFADYAQWEAARTARAPAARQAAPEGRPRERPRARRLTYREQREWEGIEQAILDAEATVAAGQRAAEDPAIASDPVALQARYAELEAARAAVDRLYARWAELDAKVRESAAGLGTSP
jgi:ABC-type multidrug transport system ATPase subunit